MAARSDSSTQAAFRHGDAGQGRLPSSDRVGLLSGQALVGLGFQAEARVQVQDHVLELRRLNQQAP
jgi:hypothetical protein